MVSGPRRRDSALRSRCALAITKGVACERHHGTAASRDLEGGWREGGFGFRRWHRVLRHEVRCCGEAFGEICFNTSLEGYLEVISDPSYAGQIITLTYPQVGNYGVNLEDAQSGKPALRGLVVRDMCATPSNWRSDMALGEYLERNGVVAIEGVDTRALVRHVRDHGAQRAVVSTVDDDVDSLLAKVRASESIVGQNLAATVSCERPYAHTAHDVPDSVRFALTEAPAARFKVIAYDCGVKRSILDGLVRAGCSVTCRAIGIRRLKTCSPSIPMGCS